MWGRRAWRPLALAAVLLLVLHTAGRSSSLLDSSPVSEPGQPEQKNTRNLLEDAAPAAQATQFKVVVSWGRGWRAGAAAGVGGRRRAGGGQAAGGLGPCMLNRVRR